MEEGALVTLECPDMDTTYQWDGRWAGIDNEKVQSKPKCVQCGKTYQEHIEEVRS